jgi:multicomponent Na+:H+ antiporter subunit D
MFFYVILLPLVMAAMMPLAGKVSRRLPEFMTFFTMVALLVVSVEMMPVVKTGIAYRWAGDGVRFPTGLCLMMDGLSVFFLVTISLVGTACSLFSMRYMQDSSEKGLFSALFLVMVAGMNGLVLTTDLFNMYVFLEVSAISAYALVAFGRKHDGVEAAFKYLMLSVVATSGILMALSFIYMVTGTLSFSGIKAAADAGMHPRLVSLCLALFVMGFAVKVGAVPFHGWLPDAYCSAPAPIAAMLSGILGKATGIYALLRIGGGIWNMHSMMPRVVMVIGVVSMLVGAMLALGQNDFRRMLAYSSISQIGYVLIGLGCATPLGIAGGLFHLFNHSIFKTLLFLDAGATEYATGTKDLTKLGGINNRLPVTGLTTTIGLFSTAGIPPFNGFWSKLIIIIALVQAGFGFTALLAVGASILTLWYFLLMQRKAFYGKLAAGLETVREAPFTMCLATLGLAALCLVIGLCFWWVMGNLIQPAVAAMANAGHTVITM